MFQNLSKAGFPFSRQTTRVINRCGATALKVGDIVKLDIVATDTDTQEGGGPGNQAGSGDTANPSPYSVQDAMYANVIPLAVVGEDVLQFPVIVTDLLGGAGADNTEVEVGIQGTFLTNLATATYAKGAPLMLTSSTTLRSLSALAATTGQRPVGVAATSGDAVAGTASLYVTFFGWASLVGGQHE